MLLSALFLALIATPSKASDNYVLKNWGIVNSEDYSHISAPNAWKISRGSKDIVVAVVDTGIDPNHLDLNSNLWWNPFNKNEYGWNFVIGVANPLDDHGHGTHVAGIIAAVAPEVSIMSVKYYSETNTDSQNLRNTVKALHYAIDHGARIINYSGGGPEFSETEYLAIKRAEFKNILIVAAAGNNREDTDIKGNFYYPAAYRIPNIISVASTDIHNNIIPSSNWGKMGVDVAAPGEQIYSTLPGNRYGYMTGTSQATGFVTGIATLLLSCHPTLKPAEIRRLIIESSDKKVQLRDKVVAKGRVNAYWALVALTSKKGPCVKH